MTSGISIFCNPILDLLVEVNQSWMAQYSLQPGGYVMYDDGIHGDIYEAVERMQPVTIPGGAGQNTARVCAHLLKHSDASVTYFGCVGGRDAKMDGYAAVMFEALEKTGVHPEYEISNINETTGTCAVCVQRDTRERSMCTNIGASANFTLDFAKKHWQTVEQSRIVYFTGFFVTASPETIKLICEDVSPRSSQLLISALSAPFIIENFSEQVLEWLRYSQIVTGNEEEYLKVRDVLGHHFNLSRDASLLETLRAICEDEGCFMSDGKPRIIIATCGRRPTITLSRLGGQAEVRVDTFPVRSVPEELVVDTNGCGDAFAGGLIYRLSQIRNYSTMTNNDLTQAIQAANNCGREVLQHVGCQFLQDLKVDNNANYS